MIVSTHHLHETPKLRFLGTLPASPYAAVAYFVDSNTADRYRPVSSICRVHSFTHL